MSNIGQIAMAALLLMGSLVHAQMTLAPLNAAQIRTELFGRAVSGEYNSGKPWAERFSRDGTSQYSENGRIAHGTMQVRSNQLCFTYVEVADMVGGCFEIWKRSRNCFDFYAIDDTQVNATTRQKQFGEAWDARAWFSDEPSTCATEQIS